MGCRRSRAGEPGEDQLAQCREVIAAIRTLEDGSYRNISEQMGAAHKIRNFYNNLLLPNHPLGDVTIDTHQVAASHLMPYSGENPEVKRNFASQTTTGIGGTYAVYADALRELATRWD